MKKLYIFIKIIVLISVFYNLIAFAAKKGNDIPIYSVETMEKVVSITFDAAWGASDTDIILELLEKYNAKSTFFMCGYWIEKYPEEAKRIMNNGHDIANHGNKHAHVASLDYEGNIREIKDAHSIAFDILGIEMDLYRPPYGEYNDTVLKAARDLGYFTIQWDVDSLDWKREGVDKMVDRVLNHKNLKNGSILLFHNDLDDTPDALEIILNSLIDKGYSFKPISELIYRENFEQDITGRQFKK